MANKYVQVPDLDAMTDQELEDLIAFADSKSVQFKLKQESLKVLCNGIYGALGNEYFRFFMVQMAEAITLNGQMIIETSRDFFNEYMNKILKSYERDFVVILDTDSVYLDFSDLVALFSQGKTETQIVDFLDKLGSTKMQDLIKTNYKLIYEDTNSFESHLAMKRESIGKAIIVQKKRYVMKVFDNEGVRYTTPDIKIMGLEPVRSTTPAWCRKKLEEAFTLVFECQEGDIHDLIIKDKQEFMKLPVKDIASPIGISDLNKYLNPFDGTTKPGATQQAKAAAAYNRHVKRLGLAAEYPPIMSGEKVRVLPLKQPNKLREEIIAFKDKVPVEFAVDDSVDRLALFEKNYLTPLERYIEVLGWTTEKKYSLDEFFV